MTFSAVWSEDIAVIVERSEHSLADDAHAVRARILREFRWQEIDFRFLDVDVRLAESRCKCLSHCQKTSETTF